MTALMAARKMFIGNWSMTAPRVPPTTIMAAVGWVIWAMLPPSTIMPARMPTIARGMPPMLAISMSVLFHYENRLVVRGVVVVVTNSLVGVIRGPCDESRCGFGP